MELNGRNVILAYIDDIVILLGDIENYEITMYYKEINWVVEWA